jgi:hypothetical protein
MGDETWVRHFEPESKQQSMQWKHTSPPPTKKLKNVPSAKKVMLILFWDINGPILEHYMEHGQTVNSERYSAMLKDKLKPAIHSKRRGSLSKQCFCIKTMFNHMPPLPQSKLFKTLFRTSSSSILLSRLETK